MKLHVFACLVLVAPMGFAATVDYFGADLSTHGAWRTPPVVKPDDPNGDNIYGTNGYSMVTSPGGVVSSLPSYISSVTEVAPLIFLNGNETTIPYTQIDNPTGPGTVFTGTWFASTAEGSEDDFVQITLSAASTFRLGILVDNHDFTDISPSSLRVRQTVGGTANSGLQTSNLQPNVNDDWYFFDISGNAGDQFTVSGVNWFNGSPAEASNGIGGVTFDSISVPEPGSTATLALGTVPAILRRRRSVGFSAAKGG